MKPYIVTPDLFPANDLFESFEFATVARHA
jgi:hypothetical protein